MNVRHLEENDLPMLQKALDRDEFPHGTVKDYTQERAFSEVYEDEQGPVGVICYNKILHFFAVLCDNKTKRRNAAVIIQALNDAVEKARSNGYTEVRFQTASPPLAEFCVKNLGFVASHGEYVRYV